MSSIPSSKHTYRPCVGIFLINDAGKVLVGRRIGAKTHAWQMPQGGIDEGEDPAAAALRELEEEIGTADACIVGESEEWIRYDLPPESIGEVWGGRYRGQQQKWFAMHFLGTDDELNPAGVDHPEFDAWQWMDASDLVHNVVAFKREVYRQVVKQFAPLLTWRG
ncbi:MAG: RNA pyrophosphohydrolase [Pseudomonadota bacterium]|nr:RNA pyrophosphohydrolase [Pseudomonadota bacterium]